MAEKFNTMCSSSSSSSGKDDDDDDDDNIKVENSYKRPKWREIRSQGAAIVSRLAQKALGAHTAGVARESQSAYTKLLA